MPERSQGRQSVDEWTALIEAYLESGLTQKAFCQQRDIGYHCFQHHYQRSPLFRGKRRSRVSTFQQAVMTQTEPTMGRWVVCCGDQVRIDCPTGTPVDKIIRLARGLADAT